MTQSPDFSHKTLVEECQVITISATCDNCTGLGLTFEYTGGSRDGPCPSSSAHYHS